MKSFIAVPSEEKISWENCGDDEVINFLDPKSVRLAGPPLNLPHSHWKYISRQRFQPVFKRFRTSDANIIIKLLEERLYEMAVEFIFKNYGQIEAFEKKEESPTDPKLYKKCKKSLISLFNEGHTLVAYDLTHQNILGILIARIHQPGFLNKNPVSNIPRRTRESWKEYNEECVDCAKMFTNVHNSDDSIKNNTKFRKQKSQRPADGSLPRAVPNTAENSPRVRRKRQMRGNITHNIRNVNHTSDYENKDNVFYIFKNSNEITIKNTSNEPDTLISQNGSSYEKDRPETSYGLLKDVRKGQEKETENISEIYVNRLDQNNNVMLTFDGNNKTLISEVDINAGFTNQDIVGVEESYRKHGTFNYSQLLTSEFKYIDQIGFINEIESNNKMIQIYYSDGNKPAETTKRYVIDSPTKLKQSFDSPDERKTNSVADHENQISIQKKNEKEKRDEAGVKESLFDRSRIKIGGFESYLMKDLGRLFENVANESLQERRNCYKLKRSRLLFDLNIKKYYYIHLLCGLEGSRISEILLHGLIKGLITWGKFIMPAESLDAIIAVPRSDTNAWLFERADFKKINQTEKSEFLDDEDKNKSYGENTIVDGMLVNDYCCYVYLIGKLANSYWNYIGKY